MIRVRFAPSPTGYLHIGGVRTALFNFLYARSQPDGKFLVRIEDTDKERSEAKYEQEILDAMKWLGMASDEPIVKQSERLERHVECAKELLQKGLAYEEEKEGKVAIKFKMPEVREAFYDLVHDKVEFDTALFDDLVIIKSDGNPTYHWACVVDDHDMDVTHVIRGDDHLSNTPRQILLYKAMGWKPPKFAHLPLIMGGDGSPLSKRHGAVALTQFKTAGFLPEALLNYLALLGWGSGQNEEIFTLEQLIKKFSLKRINKANARFNTDKLEWTNAQHLKNLKDEDYIEVMTCFWQEEARSFDPSVWRELVMLYRPRIKTLAELKYQASYCFEKEIEHELRLAADFFEKNERLGALLTKWVEAAGKLESFSDIVALEKITRELADEQSVKAKDYIHPLRFAISGQNVTPGLFELMSILGKATCLRRIDQFMQVGQSA